MSREIKFKAWHKEKKVLFDVFGFDVNHVYPYENEEIDIPPSRDEVKLMQDTNLTDENGKRIYEGYIIEGGYLNPLTGEFLSRKYVIEYDKGSFRGKLIGHTPYGDTFLSFIKGEVIGNIYEDKYLLEGEK